MVGVTHDQLVALLDPASVLKTVGEVGDERSGRRAEDDVVLTSSVHEGG